MSCGELLRRRTKGGHTSRWMLKLKCTKHMLPYSGIILSMSLAFQLNRLNFKQWCPSDKNKSRLNWYAANCKWNSLVHLVSQNQESWPNRAHTRGKSYYTPKASPRGERLTHFMLVQLSPHNQCGTNPNNPSTTDQPDTRAHTGLTPTVHWDSGLHHPECARAQEIEDVRIQ